MTVLPLDAADEVATEPVPPARRRGLPGFLRRPGGIFGAAWLTFITVSCLTAPLWVPYEVDQQDTANRLALPSAEHWLGTDPLGRDLLSRIFTAGTLPLVSSAVMLVVAFGIGVPLALLAAERGRLTERFVSRISEVFLALPLLILLLAVVGVIGNKLYMWGGFIDNDHNTTRAGYVLNLDTHQWSSLPEAPAASDRDTS